jgi:hypothetical protein
MLEFGISAAKPRWHMRCLRRFMLNPASVVSMNAKDAGFWLRLLNDETLSDCDGLEKIVIGCEIIAAVDSIDLLAAA